MLRHRFSAALLTFAVITTAVAFSVSACYRSDNLLPPKIQQRMLSKNESLTGWHIKQEALNILTMTGIMLGTRTFIRKAPSWLPMGFLMAAAGIALDFKTSTTWAELFLRQGVHLPILAARYLHGNFLGNRFPPVEEIAVEAPNILLGLYEMGQQQRSTYNGAVRIRPGLNTPDNLPPIFFSTEPGPSLTFYISEPTTSFPYF